MTAKIKLNSASGGGSFSLQAPSSSSNDRVITLPDVANGTLLTTQSTGLGKILQVVSTTKTDVFSESSLASGAFSGDAMSLSITPSNASNKILIVVNCFVGCAAANRINATIYKAGSVLTGAIGDADGSKNRTTFQSHLASVARGNMVGGTYEDTAGGTSAITYSIRLSHGSSSAATVYLNRTSTESDNDDYSRSISTITLMEVSA
tara:strand:+ start:794 stop:1411 length:618 start_codon:yes stop_codon:yes gene_type:complete